MITRFRCIALLAVVIAAACDGHVTTPPAAAPAPQRTPQVVPPDGLNAFQSARAACAWLARHQSSDGGWNLRAADGGCGDARCSAGEESPDLVGDTSLAVMALLSAGADIDSRPSGAALKSGIARLVVAQAPDGSFDADTEPHRVLDQALATNALVLACGRTSHEKRMNLLCGDAADRSLARLLALRTPGAAWSDGAAGSPCDLRVTTWATLAVAQAGGSGFDVPAEVSREVFSWLDSDPGGGTQTAAAMRTCCRLVLGTTQRDPHLVADHEILIEFDAGPDREGKATDALGRYFVTVAESRWGGDVWARRRSTGNGAVLPLQRREIDGCVCGSWDPDGIGGPEGGRVGVTALTAMLFDACYISTYANVMRAKEPQIPK